MTEEKPNLEPAPDDANVPQEPEYLEDTKLETKSGITFTHISLQHYIFILHTNS